MEMASGTAWSRVELKPHEELYIGQCDIKDCFYNIGINDELGAFFCLPAVDTELLRGLGVPATEFVHASAEGKTWPFLRRLPMGFSWAFWIVQQLHAHQVRVALGGSTAQELTDHGPVPDLSRGPFLLTYCDNGNICANVCIQA